MEGGSTTVVPPGGWRALTRSSRVPSGAPTLRVGGSRCAMPATILIPITVVSGGTPVRHAGHDRDHGNRGAGRQFASVGSFRQQPFTLPGGLEPPGRGVGLGARGLSPQSIRSRGRWRAGRYGAVLSYAFARLLASCRLRSFVYDSYSLGLDRHLSTRSLPDISGGILFLGQIPRNILPHIRTYIEF